MERVEEYLETIYDIQKSGKVAKTKDIAGKLNVKPSSVTEMLNKLSEMGYIEYQPYRGAVLTRKGLEVAERIKKNYKVFKRFFEDFLGVESEIADRLSCTLEHVADERVISRLCSIIARNCEVCEVCAEELLTLSEADDGEYVVFASPRSLKKAGVEPEKEVEVRDGVLVVDGVELEVAESLKRFVLLRRL
ncbi:iron {metal} dependent repressor, DtxR family [Geoglobus ahangari]|uniref:Iron (metal) dependent repressor, DtxR family n=1 Tax=Geoglobus ahangari TaxID=113653 RepID=A0A0F7DBU1_9EURY|nr:metal-dependent transcriptional regulator [Geoglobus ahangari]AKG91681.1 iron {metal} dependent repressor, DtxR family [Geoglobus ahangari]